MPHAHFHVISRGRADSGVGGAKSGEMSDAERKNLVLGEGETSSHLGGIFHVTSCHKRKL